MGGGGKGPVIVGGAPVPGPLHAFWVAAIGGGGKGPVIVGGAPVPGVIRNLFKHDARVAGEQPRVSVESLSPSPRLSGALADTPQHCYTHGLFRNRAVDTAF